MKKKIEISGDNMKTTEILEDGSVITSELLFDELPGKIRVTTTKPLTLNGVKTFPASFSPKIEIEEYKKATINSVAIAKLTESELEEVLLNIRNSNKRVEDAIKNAEVASYPTENIQSDGTFIMFTTDDEGREIKVEHCLGDVRYTYI